VHQYVSRGGDAHDSCRKVQEQTGRLARVYVGLAAHEHDLDVEREVRSRLEDQTVLYRLGTGERVVEIGEPRPQPVTRVAELDAARRGEATPDQIVVTIDEADVGLVAALHAHLGRTDDVGQHHDAPGP